MTHQTQNYGPAKKKGSSKNVAAGLVSLIGLIIIIGAVGNFDSRDEQELENQMLGYKKHIIDNSSKTADWAKIALGFSMFGGGIYWAKKKNNEPQR